MTFTLLENNKYILATLCLVFSIYIKIFGIVAIILFIFYPNKTKLAVYTILWTIIFFFLPLIVIDHNQLFNLYISWGQLLANDNAASTGLSVMGWFQTWFNIYPNKQIILSIGLILLILPLIRKKLFNNFEYKLLYLSSILIWIVIFNHKAESPTFIIAIAGVAVWFFTNKFTYTNIVLFLLAFIFTSLSPTDIFPRFVREQYIIPYTIKAVPCIIIWIKIIYEQLTIKFRVL